MKWQAVVDRFEGNLAVLLHSSRGKGEELQIYIPQQLLPENAREGDYLTICCQIDEVSTEAARKRVTGILERLVNRTQKDLEE